MYVHKSWCLLKYESYDIMIQVQLSSYKESPQQQRMGGYDSANNLQLESKHYS